MSIHFGGFNVKSETDCYGFEKDERLDEIPYEKFVSDYLPTLVRRTKRWESVCRQTNSVALPQGPLADRKIKRFIRKGVPSSLRPKVWMKVSGAENEMLSHPNDFKKYAQMVLDEDVQRAIELDLHRTFPDNVYFKPFPGNSTVHLNSILHAFAAKWPSIGYCQGLNFICAMLYLVLKNVDATFWLLNAVVQELPSNFYDSQMTGLQKQVEILNQIIMEYEPEIGIIFQKFGIDLSMFTTKWLICWFLETLPIETVLRIWDCLFNEGYNILMLAAVTLIVHNKERFLKCTSFSGVADVMKIIITDPFALNCHEFMQAVFSLPRSVKKAIKRQCNS